MDCANQAILKGHTYGNKCKLTTARYHRKSLSNIGYTLVSCGNIFTTYFTTFTNGYLKLVCYTY